MSELEKLKQQAISFANLIEVIQAGMMPDANKVLMNAIYDLRQQLIHFQTEKMLDDFLTGEHKMEPK